MKQALYDTASGAVLQWQDTSEFSYADPTSGQALLELPDSFVFPDLPQWVVSGKLSSTNPDPQASARQLAAAQDTQIAALRSACASAIMSGFSSNALGEIHNYPSALTDQINQSAIAQCAAGGFLWCATGATWALVPHTQTQAQEVVASFVTWLNDCQQQLASLIERVNAADSVDAAGEITWTDPSR
ncbi:hypothetical protein [Burkholderia multivorans]|uniref:hypothetical protein n=1 Tax=Burkholderia multivorans TaxID=87883 RepID=UPI000A3F9FD3|nr:hypothetical protein [Burkholderia multivorans]MBU9252461.1 hypothetical protein [Burkholderia multivorans]MBU9257603.1 hypothetical protein [Burkholderia multivorans]MDN7760112.1 hypothetical protein [Burkholderia multivorans]MDN8100299.1 hypothetical protein [Burkholderia multivorans]